MIKNYIKIAFRGFWRHKLFTLINIVGLSIGISAALVIYLIVHFDLTFDKFEKDGNRIYRVVSNFGTSPNPGLNMQLQLAAKSEVSGIEASSPLLKLIQPDVYIPQKNTKPIKFKQQKTVALTDSGYFNIIHYKWLAGSAKKALNGPYQVVLTSEQAKLYFPAIPFEQLIGKTVIYDTIKTTITGIVQTIPDNTGFAYRDFISFSTAFANKGLKNELGLNNPNNWGGTNGSRQFFVKLLPATPAANVAQQLNTILAKNYTPKKDKDNIQKISLQPLSDIHFSIGGYGGITAYDAVANKTTLYSLLTIAAFLLLLGCINFINLTTAQATQRAKEIGIRKTMGSSRAQLIVQFLSETFFITLIAVVVSVLIAPFILQLFSGFIQAGVKLDIVHQPGILVFLLALAVVVSLLSGFYPAVILSGYQPVSVLKNQVQNSSKTRNAWMRKSLTISQFVIAQFFIMATVLVGKQIYYATHKGLGFKKDGIITFVSPWKISTPGKNQVLLNKLRAMPQVEMVSLGNDEPSSENTSSTEGTYKDGKKELKLEVAEKFGDENYIKLYQIKLLAGRNIQKTDSGRAFLVNLTYTQLMGFKNPNEAVGRVIDNFNGDRPMQIVGVVSDFHQESLHAPVMPLVLLYPEEGFDRFFHIALKPQTANGNEWQTAIAGMKASWKQLYPEDDFEYSFIDETVAKLYEKEQHTATLLSWATGLSILISCLGLLGLAIYTTNQRTKEIGVRKVLGASVAQIVTLLSTELIWLIVLAFVVVTPMAWWAMNKWMQSFADRTTISWWIFAASGGAMLVAAVLTLCFQTVRAAIMNPVKSLRSE